MAFNLLQFILIMSYSPQTSDDLFSLKPLNPTCFYKQINVDFSPLTISNVNKRIIPVFNKNENFYWTDLFYNPYQMARTSQHRRSELLQKKNKFDKKTKEALNSPQQLTFKTPKKNFCQICLKQISSYQNHINTTQHRKNIRKSFAEPHIEDLCQHIKEHKTKPIGKICEKGEKKKNLRKEFTLNSAICLFQYRRI